MRALFFDGGIGDFEIVIPDYRRESPAPSRSSHWKVSRGDHGGEVSFDMALESAGAAGIPGRVRRWIWSIADAVKRELVLRRVGRFACGLNASAGAEPSSKPDIGVDESRKPVPSVSIPGGLRRRT